MSYLFKLFKKYVFMWKYAWLPSSGLVVIRSHSKMQSARITRQQRGEKLGL